MNPDYERLYHLLNTRRRHELELLEKTCHAMTETYVALAQRDNLFTGESISWERGMVNQAMVHLGEAVEAFRETDRQAEQCATEIGITLEIVHGTETHPDRRPG